MTDPVTTGSDDTPTKDWVPATVPAPPEAVFEGRPVGVQGVALCETTHESLREGDDVVVHAHYPANVERGAWTYTSLHALGAGPGTVEVPTKGCFELVAGARLAVRSDCGTQETQLVLADVEILDSAAPMEGVSP